MDISKVYLSLKNIILSLRNVSVAPHSVTSDLFLIPTATEITKLQTIQSFTAGLQSVESIQRLLTNTDFLTLVAEAEDITVDQVRSLISSALDKLAVNYNKTRHTALKATGVLNFNRPDAPDPLTFTTVIPAGTTARTTAGVTYSTTVDIPFGQYYYDVTLGLYFLDVPAECTTNGSIGNTPADTIIIEGSPVTGWGNVTNLQEWTNGQDIESDDAFCDRLKREIAGNNVGTRYGIEISVLQNFPQVEDILVVGPGDPDMQRDMGYGGMLDIYVLAKNYTSEAWSFMYNGEDRTYITGPRPIRFDSVSPVTPSTGTLTFTRDDGSVYANSNQSRDFVTWTVKPVGPYPTPVTLSYIYDKNVTDIQDFLNQPDYYTGADILIKQATEVPVDIVCIVRLLTGYSKATVQPAITRVVTDNISKYRLGQELQQSDVINWITNVTGVDKVTLPITKFNRSVLTGTVDTITASSKEYLRLSTFNITIS